MATHQAREIHISKTSGVARFLRRNAVAYMFLTPWLLGFFVLTLYPMLYSLWLGFTDYDFTKPDSTQWIGLGNYVKMFGPLFGVSQFTTSTGEVIRADPYYMKSLSVTFTYVFASVPLKLIFALAVAMLMNQRLRWVPFYRAVYYIPTLLGGSVAVAVLWRKLFERDGLVNGVLEAIGFTDLPGWITNPRYALWTLVLLSVWQFGTADHFQIIDTQLAGNNAPDIIQLGGNWPDYQQYLEPLNGYLGNQLLINTPEQFDQTALIPSTAPDGNLYAVSLGTNTLTLIYNKTMIEAAGVELPKDNMSWDELLDYGRELKAALPDGVAPFVDNSTNQANYLSYFYQQQGTPLWTLDEGGKSYATVESARKWLQMWADMREEGLIPDAETTAAYAEDGPETSALVAGKAAIGLVWSNQIAGYQAAMTDQLGATTLPTGGEDAYVIQMSQYLGINKASANKEAAALFINFFVTSPEAGAVLETNRGVPSSPVVRQAIADRATATDAAVYRIYDAIADRTIPQGPNLPNDQEFVNELELLGQRVAFGELTVDDGAVALQGLIERLAVK